MRTEIDLLEVIASAQDADEAERLFDEAAKQAEESKDHTNGWRAVELRAERRWGQLLPSKTKGRENFSVTRGNAKSGADRVKENRARKVADVKEAIFERYLTVEMKDKTPTRAGLLAAERQDKRAQVINDMTDARSGKTPSGREVQRELGLDDDRQLRRDWNILHKQGRVPARPVAAGEASQPTQARKPGRPKNFNGKTNATRLRELKGRKKTDNYNELRAVQLRISELCGALESVRLEDYGLLSGTDEVTRWRIVDIFDDLLSLAPWVEMNIARLKGRIKSDDLLERAAKFRNVDGRTPEEAKVYIARAEKLEAEALSLAS